MAIEDFDDLLKSLKTRMWNMMYFITVGVYVFVIPCFVLAGAFLAPNVKHECVSSPVNVTLNSNSDQCTYSYNLTISNETKAVEEKCTKWKYDSTYFQNTLTSEFDLVCEKAYMRPTYQTAYMVGNFIGSPLNGLFADRYGRRLIFVIGIFSLIISALISSFVSTFGGIIFTRFLTGLAHPAFTQAGYILCMEVCEPKHRSTVGMLISVPWAVGTMWFACLGYLIRDWRWLQRAAILPALLFLPFLKFIDESPRWLIVRGYHTRALKVLKTAYKRNKEEVPEDEELMIKMKEIQIYAKSLNPEANPTKKDVNVADKMKQFFFKIIILFKTPVMRKRTFLVYSIFLVSSTVFYGLSLNAVNFNLDPYLYMAVGGLMEVPAYAAPVPIIRKFGRIRPTVSFFVICGVSILALAFIPGDIRWIVITFAMAGKLCIAAAYQIAYLIASEVFPTEVRLQGLGTSNFVSRIGSIAAPYITDAIAPHVKWFPSVLFGCLSLFASCTCYLLPETVKAHLPDTVKQLEEMAKSGKIKSETKGSKGEEALSILDGTDDKIDLKHDKERDEKPNDVI